MENSDHTTKAIASTQTLEAAASTITPKRKRNEVSTTPSLERRGRQRRAPFDESIPEELLENLLSSTAANSTAFENSITSQISLGNLSLISSEEYLSTSEGPDSDAETLQATLIDANAYINPLDTATLASNNNSEMETSSMSTSTDATIITNTADTQEAEDLLRIFRSEAFKRQMHAVIDQAWDATVTNGLVPIKQSIENVKSAVEAVKTEVQPLTTQIRDIAEKAESDHNKIEATVARSEALDAKVISIQDEMDDLDQARRQNNLILSRVKESPNENLCIKVCQIAAIANLEMSVWEIMDAYRVGQKNTTDNRPRLVIVKFGSFKSKMDLYSARMNLADPFNERVFASEDLTIKRSKIYYNARQLAKAKKFQTWTQNGRILFRTTEGGIANLIKKSEDLDRFKNMPMGNFNSN